jgi:hypothetical protein
MKELQIKIEGSKYTPMSKPSYIYPIDVTDDHVYIPFAYGKNCSHGPFPRPDKDSFPETDYKFIGKLRIKQKEVKKEAISDLNNYGSTIVAASCGFGKCLGYDTSIIMYDGTIKMVQDIQKGDQLMGDDSTVRNVHNICRGEEQMYDIIPVNGIKYTVNESHILSLKISSHKSIFWSSNTSRYVVKKFDRIKLRYVSKFFVTEEEAIKYRDSILDNNLLDIGVKEYLKIPQNTRCQLKGYKVPVLFKKKKVKLDPYFLGLWLGVGSSCGPNITNVYMSDADMSDADMSDADMSDADMSDADMSDADKEIILHYSKQNGMITKNRVYTTKYNKIIDVMGEYNLINNKHIPHDYKCNDRDTQLQLLAGLIDSDGYYRKNCYEIFQTRKKLAEDIVFVCRSLGFVSKVNKKCTNTGVYYLVNIYGNNLQDIPVLETEMEKDKTRKHIKDCLTTDIKVELLQKSKYYGFTIDGNHRFLLGDFTVTHNTATSIYMASKIKMKTMVITHRIVLINQWKESLTKFCPDATVQVLTAKSKKKDCDFYIMNAMNVHKHDAEYYKDIGMLIVDEVHCIMAEGLSKCMTRLVPRYVLGLSATPYREDGMNILLDLYFGKRKIYRKLFRKHIAYKVQTTFVPTVELSANGRINWGVILESQSQDTKRNEMIIKIVKYFPDRVFLILCKRVEQGQYLVKRFKEEGEDVTSLIGKQQTYEKKSRILVGTSSKAGTGFDHPRLDAMIMAGDIQAYFIQYLGRVLRREDVVPLIFDVVDKNPILERHYKVRRSVYLEHGGTVNNFSKSYPDFGPI